MAGYRLVRERFETPVPQLDASQRRVAEHDAGPLLVLAGPGTGKTTTLVESVVRRLEHAPGPATPLLLTFSRRAAEDLRARITARLGRSTVTPLAMTFHAFCYALLRRFADPETYDTGLRLLTAPEQEFRVRETLAGALADDPLDEWPESVAAAYGTRAFAGEVRGVLARARQLGMDPDDVIELGLVHDRAEWLAVGHFMEEYLQVLDFEQVLDYAELVHRCRILLTEPEVLSALRAEIDGVFVDEYQDTDPAQIGLLQQLVGPGGDLVVVGDPDQSIYGFRGAEARSILDFPQDFPTATGEPAPVVALGRMRRFGTRIAAATRHLADRLPLSRGLPEPVLTAFRQPEIDPATSRGLVEAYTFDSPGAEAEHVADLLRQAHLHDGIAWGEMAVLVRSGRRNLPGLARALTAAGVPVEVAGDEIALSAELSVRPLLLALQVVAAGGVPDADQAARLLLSPLGGLDSVRLRRLGRLLRDAERTELAGVGLPPSSAELCRRVVADPTRADEYAETLQVLPPELEQARRLAELLAEAVAEVSAGAPAEAVLWTLWRGTDWPERLQADAARGGDTGRRADRDLDALCALFEVAARSEEVTGRRGVAALLAEVEAQQIPADTQRESDLRGRGVRLLTAHRAKGLEWRLVVVASVQEGGWPDLRVRGSLLEADRLGRIGSRFEITPAPPVSARLAEERRLFYVACTRATERLIVTAVEGTEGEGDQPSRFLSELRAPVRHRPGRPVRPLSLGALVGELRRTAVDPEQPPVLRDAAAIRLARLAEATDDDGRPLAPAADPARWWGMSEITRAPGPVVPPQEPVRLSGSALGALLDCPRRWFLSRRAGADPGRGGAASAGSVLHALVEHAAGTDLDKEELVEQLDLIWDRVGFEARYQSTVEREEAETMLERYLAWTAANAHRQLLGTEVPFSIRVPLLENGARTPGGVVDGTPGGVVDGTPGGVVDGTLTDRTPGGVADRVELTGSVDRLERLSDGRLHIVDFKTGRRTVDRSRLPSDEQLGVYQLAATMGAFEELAPGERRVGGAELVYLRVQEKGEEPYPVVLPQASLDDQPRLPETAPEQPTWVHERLTEAVRLIRAENFEARICGACRYCPFRGSCPAYASGVVA